MTPEVGLVVWFRSVVDPDPQPMAATISYINEDGTLNLSTNNHAGAQFSFTGIPLIQPGDPVPKIPYCEWPAYALAVEASSAALSASSTALPAAQTQPERVAFYPNK